MEYEPFVLWITGLSGAGKTTIGRRVFQELFALHKNTIFLDGDEIRAAIGDKTGHSVEERLQNAYRLSRLCKHFSEQGHTVVCATMSLFPEIWSWNRLHIRRYREVYLRASKETLHARDTKGIYKRAQLGIEQNVVGWDLTVQEPTDPHLIIETDDPSEKAIASHMSVILSHVMHWVRSEHASHV